MSKFRVKLKVQNLEFEIEGSREDASLLSRNIGQQMANLVQPASRILNGELNENSFDASKSVIALPVARKTRRRRNGTSAGESADAAAVIDFKHDPSKFGNPRQEWKTAEKALWLLYVVKESAGIGDLSATALAESFNKHFRQAGTVTSSNVSRDLGRLKVREKPSPVGEDTTKNPSTWYLTEQGIARAQVLVAAALGS